MEDDLLTPAFDEQQAFNILKDDFLDLSDSTSGSAPASAHEMACLSMPDVSTADDDSCNFVDFDMPNKPSQEPVNLDDLVAEATDDNSAQLQPSNLDNWDQDVLLSNAGLPEVNPLLDDVDDVMEEDFQKMLNEWENHLGSLQQTSEMAGSVEMAKKSGDAGNNIVMDGSADGNPELKGTGNLTTRMMDDTNKMTLGQTALAGIVISSGPGGHFETYEARKTRHPQSLLLEKPLRPRPTFVSATATAAILEATDADNLLDQFEASDDIEPDESSYKGSPIFKAVKNHFANNGSAGQRKNFPKIVPSQRIKDALPREIVDKIKASSQKSRTIAIIEPAANKGSSNDADKDAVKASKVAINNNSGTRFQEAATSLHRNKQIRQLGLASPQQVQVSLDHDYCSSSNKMRRSRVCHHVAAAATTTTTTPTIKTHIRSPQSSNPVAMVTTTLRKPSIVVSSPTLNARNVVRVHHSSLPIRPHKETTIIRPTINEVVVQHRRSRMAMPIAIEVAAHATSSASASSPLSSPARKDSGLESGEVSDAGSDAGLYTKVPAYLTSVNADNADSNTISGVDDSGAYDRLPAYVKGVAGARLQPEPPEQPARRRRQSSSSSTASSDTPARCPRKKRRGWRKSRAAAPARDRSRSPVEPRHVEERRIVYVGRIAEGTTRADIRKRFEVFGPIEDISLHFRDRGDNYGFVTFRHKVDAFEAIEHGNDDRKYPHVDLCFGGRRTFCKEKYADLDSAHGGKQSGSSSGPEVRTSAAGSRASGRRVNDDFDLLLKQARAGFSKK